MRVLHDSLERWMTGRRARVITFEGVEYGVSQVRIGNGLVHILSTLRQSAWIVAVEGKSVQTCEMEGVQKLRRGCIFSESGFVGFMPRPGFPR